MKWRCGIVQATMNRHSLHQENEVKRETIMNVELRNALNRVENVKRQKQYGAENPSTEKEV